MRSILLSLVVILGLLSCRSAFVSKDLIRSTNDEYTGKKFQVLTDLHWQQNDNVDTTKLVIKKGTVISIRFESSDDWIRVRGIDMSRSEEQYPGEIFLFLTDDSSKEMTGDQVIKEVEKILKPKLKPIS